MKRSTLILISAGAALALVTVGTAAGAAIAGPVDGSGVIHGCYDSGGNVRIIDTSAPSCPKGWTSLNWSQQGPAGAMGPAGPGYVFTTTSGIAPPLTQDGTYYVDAVAVLSNPSPTTPLIGSCSTFGGSDNKVGVHSSPVAGAFALGGIEQSDSVSGIVTVTGGASSTVPLQLQLGCLDTAGNPVTPFAVTWWVSPVSTSS